MVAYTASAGSGTFCNALQSKVHKQRCTWAQQGVMQVLVTVLESHCKLRLLPDGTRGSALKDKMHGVIHYPLCASGACAINESYPLKPSLLHPRPLLPNLHLVKLVRTSVESCLFSRCGAIIRASLPMHRLRQPRGSPKSSPTPPPHLKPLDFQSLGA
ncbi:hypothetical protein HaLaN_10930 [Haematococcus lacustris]|uniref:Uncharacterized protein n=1 Tax=Haematococcus lacustris TaxID=44745 RepID=A0A699YZ18_HAELA|nr:hypothetical protein HaLaN_10930 [Haematococcus lacustris]